MSKKVFDALSGANKADIERWADQMERRSAEVRKDAGTENKHHSRVTDIGCGWYVVEQELEASEYE